MEIELTARKLVDEGDVAGIKELFNKHPELAQSPISSGKTWLHFAAWKAQPEVVRCFVDLGLPLNEMNESGECALSALARRDDFETAKFLIEKGADPTVSHWPMIDAVSTGNVDLVKLFVEHGAEHNFEFGDPPRTPLSQAIDYGHQEVVDYLQSLQATMPAIAAVTGDTDDDHDELEEFDEVEESDPHEEIKEYFEHQLERPALSEGFQELVPGEVKISVWTIDSESKRNPKLIFTTGMSDLPMTVPEDKEEYQYAELAMYLPPDWPTPPNLNDSSQSWPWVWLRNIAHYPHESGTWFGEWTTTFANGDPPAPLDPSCKFTAFLLATNLGGLTGFQFDDGRTLNIITVVPIYTEELKLAKRRNGIEELLKRFEKRGIRGSLKLDRPNVG